MGLQLVAPKILDHLPQLVRQVDDAWNVRSFEIGGNAGVPFDHLEQTGREGAVGSGLADGGSGGDLLAADRKLVVKRGREEHQLRGYGGLYPSGAFDD